MNTSELIQLIETVKAKGYGHIDITHEGTHLMLDEKSLAGTLAPNTTMASPVAAVAPQVPVTAQQGGSQAPVSVDTPAAAKVAEVELGTPAVDECDCDFIVSPIVGTFYTSAGPDSDAFVKVGDIVKKGDIVCIIEAMKLMNEIEAECDGEIVELMVSNESGVEYNQNLFKIKKA